MSWQRVVRSMELHPYNGALSLAPKGRKIRHMARVAAIMNEEQELRDALSSSMEIGEISDHMDGLSRKRSRTLIRCRIGGKCDTSIGGML